MLRLITCIESLPLCKCVWLCVCVFVCASSWPGGPATGLWCRRPGFNSQSGWFLGLGFFLWYPSASNSLTSVPSCVMGTGLNLAGEWTKPTYCANTTNRGVYGTLCSHTTVDGTVGPCKCLARLQEVVSTGPEP